MPGPLRARGQPRGQNIRGDYGQCCRHHLAVALNSFDGGHCGVKEEKFCLKIKRQEINFLFNEKV